MEENLVWRKEGQETGRQLVNTRYLVEAGGKKERTIEREAAWERDADTGWSKEGHEAGRKLGKRRQTQQG